MSSASAKSYGGSHVHNVLQSVQQRLLLLVWLLRLYALVFFIPPRGSLCFIAASHWEILTCKRCLSGPCTEVGSFMELCVSEYTPSVVCSRDPNHPLEMGVRSSPNFEKRAIRSG